MAFPSTETINKDTSIFQCPTISHKWYNVFNTRNLQNHSKAPIRHQRKFEKDAQDPLHKDDSPRLDDNQIKCIQQVVEGILYHARAVDLMVLMAFSSIASEQAVGMENTKECITQLLDYLAMHPNAKVQFYASDMILNVHSNAPTYLNQKHISCCRAILPRVYKHKR